jgi:hypothetical protein
MQNRGVPRGRGITTMSGSSHPASASTRLRQPPPALAPAPKVSRTRDFMTGLTPEAIGTIDERTLRFIGGTDLSLLGQEASFDLDGVPEATIENMEYIGSYSWIDASSPSILIPGKPFRNPNICSFHVQLTIFSRAPSDLEGDDAAFPHSE